jgi:hypothetical protein
MTASSAPSASNAKTLLHRVARNIKLSRDTEPDAVRLIDALGREVMRLSLGTREGKPEALAG